ncbi:hypothetical protein [Providencia huaxiensis]|uniref:Uncharacterized protein n=1 Tax=Providencia huaxiensis TaxID=2027290 RepID=A0A8I2D8D3_9GAMM|nr:hypothetical protein [Providencia huaxiensis]MBQ0266768.1 hypothetical protein [Providencia huaxiensis]
MDKALEKFNTWLNRSTWYTGHPIDEEVFYKCAYAAHKEYKHLDAGRLRDYIEEYVNNNSPLDEGFLQNKAEDYAMKFETVSEFLSANKL